MPGSTNAIFSFGNRSSTPGMIQNARFSHSIIAGSDVKMPFCGVGSRRKTSHIEALFPRCWLMVMPVSDSAAHSGS